MPSPSLPKNKHTEIKKSEMKEEKSEGHRHSIKARFVSFLKWWLVFTGIYSVFCFYIGAFTSGIKHDRSTG